MAGLCSVSAAMRQLRWSSSSRARTARSNAIDLIRQMPHRMIHLHQGRLRDDEPLGHAPVPAPGASDG
jgi:hypothetical protein